MNKIMKHEVCSTTSNFVCYLLTLVLALAAGCARADNMDDPGFVTLDTLVNRAEHVFIGTVEFVDIIDAQGNVLADINAFHGHINDNTIRMHVVIEEALKGVLSLDTTSAVFSMWGDGIRRSVGDISSEYQGRRLIFLAKNNKLDPVHPLQFFYRMKFYEEVIGYLNPGEHETPKTVGSATMLEDGTIILHLIGTSHGLVAHSKAEYKTDHPEYQMIYDHLGGIQPGENKTVPAWSDK